jgi:hypothetical protein
MSLPDRVVRGNHLGWRATTAAHPAHTTATTHSNAGYENAPASAASTTGSIKPIYVSE